MPLFHDYIGIDYSGAGTPDSPQAGLQVYRSHGDEPIQQMPANRPHGNWSRKALAEWLIDILSSGPPTIVGIDHSFSFPISYFHKHQLTSWDAFLQHFVDRCPTDRECVRDVRECIEPAGDIRELRLTERLAHTAWSVFDFRPHGVAHSTFAGLPWLYHLRQQLASRIHCWPYDSFTIPEGISVIAEAYPTLYRKQVDIPQDLTDHQRDAYAIAAWLADRDQEDKLQAYFAPLLTDEETHLIEQEGWILGVK